MIVMPNAIVYAGSNLDILPTLPDNSVDSIVTDPPYELGFMGKSWDNSGIAYSVELWTECMRVLKPGGHLLAFGGSRTWHRLAVAIEDSGFEMRDSIAWLYGSGFPKSLDVAKAIDKQSGYDGDVIGTERVDVGMQGGSMHAGRETKLAEREIKELSPEAKHWTGWGTALKPAFEPIVVARKPLEEKTVAANVLKFGTGGLNIDGSRISTDEVKQQEAKRNAYEKSYGGFEGGIARHNGSGTSHTQGRWPANIILDPYTAELLDEQSGQLKGGTWNNTAGARHFNNNGEPTRYETKATDNSIGGASRFFYVAKASKKDRNEGLDDLESKPAGSLNMRTDEHSVANGMETAPAKNFHPTVKPTTLMEYLIKLVTPPNGTVLDPFTGSGSTGKAALLSGFKFIGIELTEEYLPIIEGRLKWATEQASKTEEEKNEVLF